MVRKELLDAKRVYPTELLPTIRDPRLSQTVALTGHGQIIVTMPTR